MIERFNGRIAEVLATTRFNSAEHFADTIKRYVRSTISTPRRKHWATFLPLQAMKNWSQKQPSCSKNVSTILRYLISLESIKSHKF